MFYGWSNLTPFEEEQIQKTKDHLREKLSCDIPEDFHDREVLKFTQAYDFNTVKAATSLRNHFDWNNRFLKNAVMTQPALRLISSGAMYIFGRDQFYRPNFIFDQV